LVLKFCDLCCDISKKMKKIVENDNKVIEGFLFSKSHKNQVYSISNKKQLTFLFLLCIIKAHSYMRSA